MQTAPISTERYVHWPEMLRRTGLSKRTIWRRSALGTFPTLVKLSDQLAACPVEEFEAWMDAPGEWRKAA